MGKKVVCVDQNGHHRFDAIHRVGGGWRTSRAQSRRREVIEEETGLTVAELSRVQRMFSRLLTQWRNETAVERRHRGGRFADEKDELKGVEESRGKESWIWRVLGVEKVLE